jgi:hypothetical protein
MEKERQRERILKKMDKRNMIVLYGDDVPDEKWARKSQGLNHSTTGVQGRLRKLDDKGWQPDILQSLQKIRSFTQIQG